MSEIKLHEVYFGKYCRLCKYKDRSEEQDPCYDCLVETVNEYSHKPVKFESNGVQENTNEE